MNVDKLQISLSNGVFNQQMRLETVQIKLAVSKLPSIVLPYNENKNYPKAELIIKNEELKCFFEQLFNLSEKQNKFENSDFFKWINNLFKSKFLYVSERTQNSFKFKFDENFAQSLWNQICFLIDKCNLQIDSQVELELKMQNGTFHAYIHSDISIKEMIINLLTSYNKNLFQEPLFVLLNSIKRGNIEIDLEQFDEKWKNLFEWWKMQLSENEDDLKFLFELWQNRSPIIFQLELPDMIKFQIEYS